MLFQQIIENVLAPKIVGSTPQLTSDLWDRMYHEAIPRRGGEGIVRICISALDMALWDIKGKAAGVPVSTTWPSSRTTIMSASRMVERRWAIIMVVLSAFN